MAAYDVFISHCGVDSKRNFAIFLKEELERVGLRCFFDDASLKVGDKAADKMLDAMECATFGVASSRLASSAGNGASKSCRPL
jgi:hypothetical protein